MRRVATIFLITIAVFSFLTAKAWATRGDVLATYNLNVGKFVFNRDANLMYASIPGQGSVAIINCQTLELQNLVYVGQSPQGMALSQDGTRLFVALSGTTQIAVLDTTTLQLLPGILLPQKPYDIEAGLSGRLFVTPANNSTYSDIMQVDVSGNYLGSFSLGVFVYYSGLLEISPDRSTLYFANKGLSPGTIAKYDVSTPTPALLYMNPHGSLGSNGLDLALSNSGDAVYYAVGGGNISGYNIAKISTSGMTVAGILNTGPYPSEIAMSPDDNIAYVVHQSSHIDIFDTNTFTNLGQIPTASEASELINDSSGHLFAAMNSQLVVYNTKSVVSQITSPANGSYITDATCTISGSASSDAGVAFVEVSTDGGETWNTANGTTSWSYLWTSSTEGTFGIKSRATDPSNSVENISAGITVRVDKNPPVSSITFPADGESLAGTTCTIHGTADDGLSGSGVSVVEVSTDGGNTWRTCAGTTSWSYSWTLPQAGEYVIISRARDNSGRVEMTGAGVRVTSTVANYPLGVSVTPAGAGSLSCTPSSPDNRYIEGATVSLTASPSAGYRFNGWTGDAVSASNPLAIVMDSAKSIIATFVELARYLLTVQTSPSGAGSVSFSPVHPGNIYYEGENVWLTASPSSGYVFTGWGGNASGSLATIAMPMNSDKTVTANFVPAPAGYSVAEAPFNWVEIANPENLIGGLYGDDVYTSTPRPIGFTFDFYGSPYSNVYISTNGLVGFSSSGMSYFSNTPLPSTGQPNGVIAALWDDLYSASGSSGIYCKTIGSAPNRVFVVEWKNLRYLSGTNYNLTFEALLHEDTGKIVMQYYNGITDRGSATVGIEKADGTSGLAYEYNTANVTPQLAIEFMQAPGFGSTIISPSQGEVISCASYTITGTAAGGASGVRVVDISLDGGVNWDTVSDTSDDGSWSSWSYIWGLPLPGTYIIKSRATDNLGFTESGTGRSVTVGYHLSLSALPDGMGALVTDPASQSGNYAPGAQVTIRPVPSSCAEFTGWGGDATGIANPLTFTMDADKTITANFIQNETVLLTLSVNDPAGGIITPSSGEHACGESIIVTAVPNSCYQFTGWSGDAAGSTNPVTVVAGTARSITANFSLKRHHLTTAVNNTSWGSVTPSSGDYDCGSTIQILATPNPRYRFKGWSGVAAGSENPLSLTVDTAKNITAIFEDDPGTMPGMLEQKWKYGLFGSSIGVSNICIADIDGDGNSEMVMAATSSGYGENSFWYVVEHNGGGIYGQAWVSKPCPSAIRRIIVSDINGDGVVEILIGFADGTVKIFNGRTMQETGSFGTGHAIVAMVVADTDSDGRYEVVTSDGSGIYVHAASDFGLKWSNAGWGGNDIAVGDVDSDHVPDIVVAGSHGYVIDGVTHALKWDYASGFGVKVRVGDVDGDGRGEVVGAAAWYNIRVFDAVARSIKWNVTTSQDLNAIRVLDTNGDGIQEILYGDQQWGSLHCLDGVARSEVWSISNPDHGMTDIALGEVNSDGALDVVWGAGATSSGPDYLHVADVATRTRTSVNIHLDGPLTAVDMGDVDGDGQEEVVMSSFESENGYDDGIIHIFDAKTHVLEWQSTDLPGINAWSGVCSLKVADVDGDGASEYIIATANTYDGLIQVYDGSTHALKRQSVQYFGASFKAMAIGDVDGDGRMEIVVGQQREHTGADGIHIIVFDGATGAEKWKSPILSSWGSVYDIKLADVDGDGHVEITVAVQGTQLYVFDGVTHVQKFYTDIPAYALYVSDADLDGRNDILVGKDDGSVDVYDGSSFTLKGSYNLGIGSVSCLMVNDIDSDGDNEWIVGDNDSLYVYDGATKEPLWRDSNLGSSIGKFNHVVCRDIDGYGRKDIILGSAVALYQYGYRLPASKITHPSEGIISVGASFNITGTAHYGKGRIAVVEVSTDGGETWRHAADASVDGSWTEWLYECDPLPLGPHSIKSRATGVDGCVEITGMGVDVTVIDVTPPVVDAGPDKTANAGFMQTATATDASSMTFTWSKVSGPGTIIFGTPSALSTTVSADVDGNYILRFNATDAAGNTSSSDINMVWDTTAPSSAIVSPLNSYVSGTTCNVSGTANDSGCGVSEIDVSTDGGVTWHAAAGTTSWSYNWSIPAIGSHTIKSRATDNLGNVEIPGAGTTVTVDGISLSFTQNARTVTLNAEGYGSGVPLSGKTFKFYKSTYNVTYSKWSSWALIGSATSATDGTATKSFSLNGGKYRFKVVYEPYGAVKVESLPTPNCTIAPVAVLSPKTGTITTDKTPSASWKAFIGATGYVIQTCSNYDFRTGVYETPDLGNVTTADLPELARGVNKFWRVIALPPTGRSVPSAPRYIIYKEGT